MAKIPRRGFLAGAGAASASAAALTAALTTKPAEAAATDAAPVETWLVLTAGEVAFFFAPSATMIPKDELSPSGSECGVPTFIDRQLAGAFGAGARMYRSGPFHQGAPEQGYQLPLTPRDFFAAGVEAANAWSRKTYSKSFDRLSPEQRIQALKEMEEGKAQFDGLDAKL